ncbi:terminase small subunit [Dongia rigui]|uniref:Terminase small subunit n=1 Tax=Dongia rigui TaxID=940149 RepID=A0ABU5E0T1_9PROT|nr:terminase small subunit [Dongia rigui]MDY0872824.1 terminase small subunit [Dongia rigui]
MKAPQDRDLTPQQDKFVDLVVGGMNASQAAREAGYSKEYARRAADKLIRNNTRIRAAIDKRRQVLRDSMAITRENRVKSILEDMELARQHKNMNAVMKGQEIVAKMGGLMIDKVEMTQVSVIEALAAARARVQRPALPVIDVPAEPARAISLAPKRARVNPFQD